MYRKQTKDYTDICISERDCDVYWLHSLCVFKNERGKGICQKKILPELIEFLKKNSKKPVLLLADVIDKNYPSFNCFFDNGFDCTKKESKFSNTNGLYYNSGLNENCKMLLRVIKPNTGGNNKKNKKNKKTKKNKKKYQLKVNS